jgi:hypothetical protein
MTMRERGGKGRIGPIRRRAVLLGASLFLTSVAFAADRANAARWDDLPADQRSRALKNYRKYESLPPGERRNFDDNARRWQSKPPEEKERLRKKFRQIERKRH